MKKIFALLSVTLFSFAALARGIEIDSIYYVLDSTNYTASVTYTGNLAPDGSGNYLAPVGGSITYTSKNTYAGDIVIPDTVVYSKNMYAVTSIGGQAFFGCSNLTSITIPNTITSIGTYLPEEKWDDDSLLIPIPAMAGSGEHYAFEGCVGLSAVYIYDLETWYKIYFSDQSSNPLCYAQYLFLNNVEITDVVIPSSITKIKQYAFNGWGHLVSVTIPNSVTTIGDYTFGNCSGLTSITCMAVEPPSLGDDVFYAVPRDIPLYVPASSIPAYQAAEGWNKFDIQPLLVEVDPITPDTTQLSWLPVDSASLYKLRIYSEQIELDTTLLIEADSLNGGISIPITLAPNRVRRMPMDDIGSVVVITLEPNSGATKDTPFKVTVSTTSKDKIDIGFDLTVLKEEKTIKQESGSFTLNAPILDGLEDIPMSRLSVSSGIYDLYGHRYSLSQWHSLPAGIYILREGEKASKVMKQ